MDGLENALAGQVGVWVPFKTINACDSITPKCPLASGTTAIHTLSFEISKAYPAVSEL